MGKLISQVCSKGWWHAWPWHDLWLGILKMGLWPGVLPHTAAFCLSSRGQRILCMNACLRAGIPCAVYQPLNRPVVSGSFKGLLRLNAPCRVAALCRSKCVGDVLLRRVVSVPHKCLWFFSTTSLRSGRRGRLSSRRAEMGKGYR